MNEAGLNESETRAELIDPALKEAGWGVVDGSRVRSEMITLGRLQVLFAKAPRFEYCYVCLKDMYRKPKNLYI